MTDCLVRALQAQVDEKGIVVWFDPKRTYAGLAERLSLPNIATDPQAPGSVYTAAVSADQVALHRIEVSRMSGTGKLRITGNPDRSMKQSIETAFDYIHSRKTQVGIEKDLESYDLHVQIIDLMSPKEGSQAGVAFFVVFYSLLREMPVEAGLVVLGEMTIHGNNLPVRSLAELLRVIMDNGAKKVLIPLTNKRDFFDVPGETVEKVDPIFYSEPLLAALKAVGIR